MRFLSAVIVACLALSAVTSAQQLQDESIMNDYDFDVSGKVGSSPVQQQQATIQQQNTLPIHEQQEKHEPVTKTNTIMLQPIVLLPRKQKHLSKSINLDVDRAMAYRVSPTLQAENSRSVNVEFTPILNAKMRNILLTQQEQEQLEDIAIPSRRLPIKQQYQYIPESAAVKQSLPVQQQPMKRELPVQQSPIQQQFSSRLGAVFSGVDSDYITSPISARYGVHNIEQPVLSSNQWQGAQLNENIGITRSGLGSTSTLTLASFDESLPAVAATTENLVKLGAYQPTKFKAVLDTCIQQQADSTVCNRVFKAAKLIVRSQADEDMFTTHQF